MRLDLPPLTLILLLAFLWLILLVLLLWSWLRPRRTSETSLSKTGSPQTGLPETSSPEIYSQSGRDNSRRTRTDRDDFVDEPRLPRPQIVRETTPKAQDDAFENFNPKKRNDDFDF